MSGIIAFIWKLFGSTLINIALTVGLPKAIEWLMSKGLPKWLVDGLIVIAKSALEQISSIKQDERLTPAEKTMQIKAVKRQAKRDANRHCSGAGCLSETKAL